MGGGATSQDPNTVMIPELGAGKYWYVDPRSTGVPSPTDNIPFNPMAYADEQGHTGPETKKALKDIHELQDAMLRMGIGLEPENAVPSL